MSLLKSKKDNLTFDIHEIEKFIMDYPDAKILIGCDSVKLRKQKVRYATVIVIHYGAALGVGKGAKVFGEITYDKITDSVKGRPFNRMIAEVQRTIDMYTRLEDVLMDRIEDVELHCDINPDDNHGSHVAHGAAKGMIKGLIGIEPIFKPYAWAASYAGDKYCNM